MRTENHHNQRIRKRTGLGLQTFVPMFLFQALKKYVFVVVAQGRKKSFKSLLVRV